MAIKNTPPVNTSHISDETRALIFSRVQSGTKMKAVAQELGETLSVIRSIMAQESMRHGSANRGRDGWSESRLAKARAMLAEGRTVKEIAKALQISKTAVYAKLVRTGDIVPTPENTPIVKSEKEESKKKWHPLRYERDDGMYASYPLPAGHPLAWGAISDQPWKEVCRALSHGR